jgi:plastocyanin
MNARRIHPALPVLLLLIGALALGACGDDDGDTTTTPADEGVNAPAETAEDAAGEVEEGAEDAAGEVEQGAEDAADAPAPSGDAVRSAKVEIVDFAYQPDPVTIEEGGKVTWINRDAEAHTATADDGSFDTGNLGEGKLGSASFKEPGEYAYFCELHPSMRGTVEVVESG